MNSIVCTKSGTIMHSKQNYQALYLTACGEMGASRLFRLCHGPRTIGQVPSDRPISINFVKFCCRSTVLHNFYSGLETDHRNPARISSIWFLSLILRSPRSGSCIKVTRPTHISSILHIVPIIRCTVHNDAIIPLKSATKTLSEIPLRDLPCSPS